MGWSYCLAIDHDPETVTWLSKQVSYSLHDGCLRAFMDGEAWNPAGRADREEWPPREPGPIGYAEDLGAPETWTGRDPIKVGDIFRQVRSRLQEENERLPVDHFLWQVDEDGRRWGGSNGITLPFGGIDMVFPHDPIVKLDGSHDDVEHRHELKRYNVRIDPDKLEQFEAQLQREARRLGIKEGESYTSYGVFGEPRVDPFVEETDGWLRVEPVLYVLGERIEVDPQDAIATYGPELDEAIALCDRARAEGRPVFWLVG